MLGRLQHGRVPAEDRRERLPGDVRQRRVERDQERRDADRPPEREHGAVRHRGRRRAAVRAASLARDEESHLDRGVGLAQRERERLAGLRGDELARFLAPLAKQLCDRAHDVAPLDRGSRSPRGLRRSGRGDGCGAASSAPDRATRQSSSPSSGRAFSSHSPVAGGRSSPATRFGTRAGITRPTSRRRRRGSRR